MGFSDVGLGDLKFFIIQLKDCENWDVSALSELDEEYDDEEELEDADALDIDVPDLSQGENDQDTKLEELIESIENDFPYDQIQYLFDFEDEYKRVLSPENKKKIRRIIHHLQADYTVADKTRGTKRGLDFDFGKHNDEEQQASKRYKKED